jgi:hypothetical protein
MMDYNHQEEFIVNWPHQGAHSDDRRRALLEHWPRRNSSVSSFDFDGDDNDAGTASSSSYSSSNKKRHYVRFSESSQLHRYERESMYLLRSLVYTKEGRNEFGREAYLEGLRIRELIRAAPPDSVADSIKYLLRHYIISKEEFVGIEHFILGKPSRVVQRRRKHAAAVLRKQRELQHEKLKEDVALGLGRFARSSSFRSSQRARVRAATVMPMGVFMK